VIPWPGVNCSSGMWNILQITCSCVTRYKASCGYSRLRVIGRVSSLLPPSDSLAKKAWRFFGRHWGAGNRGSARPIPSFRARRLVSSLFPMKAHRRWRLQLLTWADSGSDSSSSRTFMRITSNCNLALPEIHHMRDPISNCAAGRGKKHGQGSMVGLSLYPRFVGLGQ
jgi:hypothetical protein